MTARRHGCWRSAVCKSNFLTACSIVALCSLVYGSRQCLQEHILRISVGIVIFRITRTSLINLRHCLQKLLSNWDVFPACAFTSSKGAHVWWTSSHVFDGLNNATCCHCSPLRILTFFLNGNEARSDCSFVIFIFFIEGHMFQASTLHFLSSLVVGHHIYI